MKEPNLDNKSKVEDDKDLTEFIQSKANDEI